MAQVPDTADIREYLWGVEDASTLLVSSASAVATALEYHQNRMNQPQNNLSTMFIHYNALVIAGLEGQNAGTSIIQAFDSAAKYGACREETWPLDPARLHEKPPAHAYEEAKKLAHIRQYDPTDVHDAISKRYPVVFIASLPWKYLDESRHTGTIAQPSADDMNGELYHHAMVLVAYDKHANTVTARNCWGTQYGNSGHCSMTLETYNLIAGKNVSLIIATPESAGKEFQSAAADGPVAQAAPAPPVVSGERLSDIAKKLKEEIRADLRKDLEESQKKIREMMKKPGGQ